MAAGEQCAVCGNHSQARSRHAPKAPLRSPVLPTIFSSAISYRRKRGRPAPASAVTPLPSRCALPQVELTDEELQAYAAHLRGEGEYEGAAGECAAGEEAAEGESAQCAAAGLRLPPCFPAGRCVLRGRWNVCVRFAETAADVLSLVCASLVCRRVPFIRE